MSAGANYLTPVGAERITRELNWLHKDERPRIVSEVQYAASLGDRSENAEYIYGKKRLREIDRRVRVLIGRLSRVQIIDPALIDSDRVVFGATVRVEDEEGIEHCYRLWGEGEVDVDNGVLSWKSPLGRALMGKRVGDDVTFKAPKGDRYLELIEIRYDPQDPIEPAPWELRTIRS
jgi:transcription elongation factor GreB